MRDRLCKGRVPHDFGVGFRGCHFLAKYDGFCGIHNPAMANARQVKARETRGPSAFERTVMAIKDRREKAAAVDVELVEAKAEITRLREALEFYENYHSYCVPISLTKTGERPVILDRGERARKAMAQAKTDE